MIDLSGTSSLNLNTARFRKKKRKKKSCNQFVPVETSRNEIVKLSANLFTCILLNARGRRRNNLMKKLTAEAPEYIILEPLLPKVSTPISEKEERNPLANSPSI